MGYELNTDGLLCDDVDECLVENGGCQQTCLNVVGDWRCECDPGFTIMMTVTPAMTSTNAPMKR